ncbi:MAG TPA: methyltransferase domain-containing protein [Gemmatimonadota bacterium]|nr:methyltransferase domain-containing protein [Gemmatimonadota bacterium]
MKGKGVRPSAEGDRVFGALAADYSAGRPAYPAAVFELLRSRIVGAAGWAHDEAPLVVDVAAGTGIASDGLLRSGFRVAGIEPAVRMLAQGLEDLAGRSGWRGAAVARAEALPLRESAVAGVVVAQAFHWLEARPALDEFARVLEPGGVLLVMWNVTEPTPLTREVRKLVRRHNHGRKRAVTPRMRESPPSLRRHPAFAVEPMVAIDHQRSLAPDDFVRYARSWSYVGGALGPSALTGFERELRDVLERHVRNGNVVERFVTSAHFARRL